jgi:hypothetical protein
MSKHRQILDPCRELTFDNWTFPRWPNQFRGLWKWAKSPHPDFWFLVYLLFATAVVALIAFQSSAYGQGTLPGTDASDRLEAAGTLLRLIDTALFKWGARIFAGVSIMSAAWALKEQRFGIAIICIVGALIFGTAPTWVKNIFSISTSDSVFGLVLAPWWWASRSLNRAFEGGLDA